MDEDSMEGDLIDLRSPGGPLAHRIRMSKHSDDGGEAEEFSFQPFVPTLSKAPVYSLIDDTLLSDLSDADPSCTRPCPDQQAAGNPVTVPTKKQPMSSGYADLVMLDTPRRPAAQEEARPERQEDDQDGDTQMSCQEEEVHSLGFITNTSVAGKHEDEAHSEPCKQHVYRDGSDLSIRLQKTEALRDALSREVGQHKANISKLEGSISSYEKQIKQKDEENMQLKARLAAVEREAAEAKIAAGVTPERCRVSARALTDEAQRAQQACQQKEAELAKLQSLLQYESQEVLVLKEFINQERLTLQSQNDTYKSQLDAARAAASHSQTRATSLAAQLQQAQDELRDAKREVWSLNNSCIELKAEAAASKAQVSAAQAAAAQAQQQLAVELEARRTAQAEMQEVRSNGIKLYKQEWCVRQAPFWGAQADQAAADADLPPLAHPTGTAADLGSSSGNSSGGGGAGEDVTLNLAAVMSMKHEAVQAPHTVSKK